MRIGIESKGKTQPKTNFRDAMKSFGISMGIKESFQTGQVVYLPKYWEDLGI
jgi:hypothetical protein